MRRLAMGVAVVALAGCSSGSSKATTDGTLRNGADIQVGVAKGQIGKPAKLGSSITILIRSVKVSRVGAPFDQPTWVLVVDGRFENRTDEEAYVDVSTVCKGQETGYYLVGSAWSGMTGPAPAQSYLDGPVYMLAPGQTGSRTAFTPCKGTRLQVERSGAYSTDDLPTTIEYPLPDALLRELSGHQPAASNNSA